MGAYVTDVSFEPDGSWLLTSLGAITTEAAVHRPSCCKPLQRQSYLSSGTDIALAIASATASSAETVAVRNDALGIIGLTNQTIVDERICGQFRRKRGDADN